VQAFKEAANTGNFDLALSYNPKQQWLFKNVDGVKFLNHNGSLNRAKQSFHYL
jgi:hypothetical protein